MTSEPVRIVGAALLLAGCSLTFDASKIPSPDGGGDAALGGAGQGGAAGGLPATLALWRFEGTGGQPPVLRDRGDARLGVDLFAVLSAEFGRATVEDGVLVSERATFRSDPVPGTAMVQAIEAARAFSAEAWVQIDRANEGKGSVVGTSVFNLLQTSIGSEIAVTLTGEDTFEHAVTLLLPTQRRHLVGVFAETTGVARIYLDGDEAAQHDYRTASGPPRKLAFPMGESRVNIGSASWRGRMELVAIYDRALTPAEVRALFLAGPKRP